MLHGMVNATGALYILYIANWNELYSWIAGWAGIVSALAVTIGISLLDKKFVKEYHNAAWFKKSADVDTNVKSTNQ